MKEHFQDYGIRKWAGNDLIELQSEPMEALQKLVEPYAPCILQGCKTTGNEDGSITVEAGLVALQGKDYKGEDCVKIARFVGIANEKPPIYLTLECEPEKRVYGDSQSKAIAYNYKAVATTQEPEVSYLEINAKENKRLVDTLGITQKLDREGGDASQTKVAFNNEGTTEDLKSGNTLSKLFGGIKKWLGDIKNKLDGIEKGAQVNVKANWTETNTESDAFIQNKPGNATAQKAGFMSKEDKEKLDGIAKGAKVNVKANWAETNTNSDAYIENKPTIPTLNSLLDSAGSGSATPTDDAILIVSGNGTDKSYYKKSLSLLWKWIKSKLHTVATSGNYNDLTNKPTIPTVDAALSTTSTNPVQNKVVKTALDVKAPLTSPTFTGTPKSVTPASTDNSANIATTAFVKSNMVSIVSGNYRQTILDVKPGQGYNLMQDTTLRFPVLTDAEVNKCQHSVIMDTGCNTVTFDVTNSTIGVILFYDHSNTIKVTNKNSVTIQGGSYYFHCYWYAKNMMYIEVFKNESTPSSTCILKG